MRWNGVGADGPQDHSHPTGCRKRRRNRDSIGSIRQGSRCPTQTHRFGRYFLAASSSDDLATSHHNPGSRGRDEDDRSSGGMDILEVGERVHRQFTRWAHLSRGAAECLFLAAVPWATADNQSSETGLLRQWPAEGPRLLWRSAGIGRGFGTVSIAENRIYVAGDVGDKTVISALDLDGRILWQAENGPIWTGAEPGSRGTPTIDRDRLYHLSAVGSLVCLDVKSGRANLGFEHPRAVREPEHHVALANQCWSMGSASSAVPAVRAQPSWRWTNTPDGRSGSTPSAGIRPVTRRRRWVNTKPYA